MLWRLDPAWLMMAVATVSVLSYFFGSALHWLMREDGFGSFGNAIIVCRLFLTLIIFNQQGYALPGLQIAVMMGLGGSFLLFPSLTFDVRGANQTPLKSGYLSSPTMRLMSPAVAPPSRSRPRPVSFSLFDNLRPSGPSTSG